MELLDKIIDGATEHTEPLPNLLRKCLVLAHRLKNDKLSTWAGKELNGYQEDDQLPSYRIIRIVSKGFFIGPGGSRIDDQPLTPSVLKPEHRDWTRVANLTQPIASYELFNTDANPQIPWPPGLTAMYQTKFFPHYVLNRAWQEIPASAFVGLKDTVRNRILSLALELKSQLVDVSDKPEQLAPEKVDQSVVFHIYGNNNIIASTAQAINQAGRDVVITQNWPAPGSVDTRLS
jgi:AbiTii-like protein